MPDVSQAARMPKKFCRQIIATEASLYTKSGAEMKFFTEDGAKPGIAGGLLDGVPSGEHRFQRCQHGVVAGIGGRVGAGEAQFAGACGDTLTGAN